MKQHPNFYESIQEAQMRLRGTVVMYDGEPYYVFAICNHKTDGIFRIYLDPIGRDPDKTRKYPPYDNYAANDPALGPFLDQWMEANPDSGCLRKMMNSSKFNKFRPYPLGMCNVGTRTVYLERQPQRKTEQGLTKSMLFESLITTGSREEARQRAASVDLFTPAFKACVLAEHPSAQSCLDALLDPKIENESAAFHRNFAFVRGPIEMVFLAYKSDIIGVLPKNNFDYIRLGRGFRHTKEVVQDLGLFKTIIE